MTKVDTEFSRASYTYKSSSILASILHTVLMGHEFSIRKWGLTIVRWEVPKEDSMHLLIRYKTKWAFREDLEFIKENV